MTTPAPPFRCPVKGCTTTSPDLVTHMEIAHGDDDLMTAFVDVTATLPLTDTREQR